MGLNEKIGIETDDLLSFAIFNLHYGIHYTSVN